MSVRPIRQPTQLERITSLEAQRDATEERLTNIEKMLKPIYDVFVQAKGIRWLLIALGSFAGVTATTVTATIAAIRWFTGH